jgi:ferredoxin, 2Fe-2S
MPQIHFISFDGIRRSVETQIGENLMRAATDNAVPGIDGDCGGQCACATCHVFVSTPWAERLPIMRTNENDILEFTNERRESSRLACQIVMTAELDGIEVHMPEGQH